MKKIAVLTSGGNAPGMNAAIRAVTRAALAEGIDVYGVRQGYRGLVEDDIEPLSSSAVGGICHTGGTVLGSARCPEFSELEIRKRALENLSRKGIEALIVIGGNGSQTGSHALHEMGFPVVGIASTIDNDLAGPDITIGVDSALNVALEAIDRLKTTGASHRFAFLVEVMGRNCGYLALMSGLAGGAEAILLPEKDMELEDLVIKLKEAALNKKTTALVVVAEGAKNNASACMEYFRAHGERLGYQLRATVLGHIQRGAAPSAFDRVLAARCGGKAIQLLLEGQTGSLVGLMKGEIGAVPLNEIAGKTKGVDLQLLHLAEQLNCPTVKPEGDFVLVPKF
ncbi:MAG: 6-phosphofructokinase [Gammaproteobacteria bacterium]|nr:MAG: 6-phosphofructokinase [Gammaproteobacteria bacterium]